MFNSPTKKVKPGIGTRRDKYAEKRNRERNRNAAASSAGRDIGDIPPVKNPERRAACGRSFRKFCETYFSQRFNLAWSDDHLDVIKQTQRVVLHGGLQAESMPRGSGKTSIVECAVLWASLYARHKMISPIGAEKTHATEILDSIKIELETNDLLAADFPEVCYPVRMLEGISNRCKGQTCAGVRTRIRWTESMIIFPTITGSPASGTIIKVAGLMGRIRGLKHTTADGTVHRPSLAIIDDPQTSDSAASGVQNAKRERILAADILYLAGPGKKISAILPCTVIRAGDMADKILDRAKHPEWNGIRTKMVYEFPKNEKLWEEYAKIYHASFRAHKDFRDATAFYKKNRAAMDIGAVVGWPARYDPGELSALQNAMNLKLRDETSFWAECQNSPLVDTTADEIPSADEIAGKLNRRKRGRIPTSCEYLTAMIDVHKKLLYWTVIAWEPNFTGYVIDYGSYPDQKMNYYSMREARKTLATAARGSGEEAAIYAGLEALAADLLAREFIRDDNATMRVSRCPVDSGWNQEVVDLFCKQSKFPGVVIPSKGLFVGASSFPWDERKHHKGQRHYDHCYISASQGKHGIRRFLIDSNHWKTFAHARLATPIGDPGAISLFGASTETHRLISEHWSAEYRIATEGRGRTVNEYKLPPHKPDNHFLDCLVGCCAAAATCGCQLLSPAIPKATKTPTKKRARKARYF